MKPRAIATRRGSIRFPAYVPVTTFGDKCPLDRLIQPYLPRLADAVMVSYHYARQLQSPPRLPLMVDSGGFAALFKGSRVRRAGGLGVLDIQVGDRSETLDPGTVLALQERIADLAFSLDFPIPPGTPPREAARRQDLSIRNAHWALANRRRRDLPLYACIQAWDPASASACALAYVGAGFDGIALGGLVPRARDRALLFAPVEAVRDEIGDLPLHCFGLDHPGLVAG